MTQDSRYTVAKAGVRATVVLVLHEWQVAYAETADGERYMLSEGTSGVVLKELAEGDELELDASEYGWAIRAWRVVKEPWASRAKRQAWMVGMVIVLTPVSLLGWALDGVNEWLAEKGRK